jgi:membrane-associated phospholipid phosphatase
LAVAASSAAVTLLLGLVLWHRVGPLSTEARAQRWLLGRPLIVAHHGGAGWGNLPWTLAVLPGQPAGFVALLLLAATLCLLRRDWRALVFATATPLVAVGLTERVLKPLVHRTTLTAGTLSYPSGHTAAATAFAAVGFVLAWRWGGQRIALWSFPLFAALPIATGVAVLVLRWHYVLDVPGGWGVGIAIAALGAALLLVGRQPRSVVGR